MNFIINDKRDFLPKDTKELVIHKEKYSRYRKHLIVSTAFLVIVAFTLVLFPQVVSRLSTPIYGTNKQDPIISQGFQIKVLKAGDVKTVLAANNIQNSNIASVPQLGEIIVRPEVQEQEVKNADQRVLILHKFLIDEGSPMAASAATFVQVADKYGIDWRLLPAIAGTESGFGRVIPLQYNGTPSYNAFGFGVYGGTFISFQSWDDAIQQVGKGLATTYGVENLKPSIMEQSYTPPSYYGDHHWRNTVTEFMSEL